MDYIQRKGYRPLQRRRRSSSSATSPPGNTNNNTAALFYRNIWTRSEGRAINALLSEPRVWRQVWIVQELLVACSTAPGPLGAAAGAAGGVGVAVPTGGIEVRCGGRAFEWRCLEQVRVKLRKIEAAGRIEHHPFAAGVLESFAMRMAEEKAGLEKAGSAAVGPVGAGGRMGFPLRQLLERCAEMEAEDPRDKVFALLGLAGYGEVEGKGAPPPALEIDYEMSVEELYGDVLRAVFWSDEFESAASKENFAQLLQRTLKLSPTSSLVRMETKRVLETHDATAILGASDNMAYISLMNQLVAYNMPGIEEHVGIFSQSTLLDASGVDELCSRYDHLLTSIQAKWYEVCTAQNKLRKGPS